MTETTDGTKAPAPQVWATMRSHDAPGLIRFLVQAFGFEETAVYTDGDVVQHAQLSWPEGGGIMLGSVKDAPDDNWPIEPGTTGCYVVTADPAALCERARGAGARIVREITEQDYGSTEFMALDPDGNRWSFGTYPGEPRA